MKWLGPVLVVVLAVLAELSLGRARSGPGLALFFGRFHPLVVHLPIGFFLLVALAEGATFVRRLRERVEPALGLLLPLSALAALAAFLMGQLLALEGGFPAATLGWHRRLTLLAVIGMSACWVLYERSRAGSGGGRLAYRGALLATLGVLSLGAHFGGTMTRGESYLSKYAPEPLKPLLGAAEEPRVPASNAPVLESARDPLVFDDVVLPLLKNYCFECHGTEKQKGKLRVDSLALLLAGGESGAVLVPGDAQKSPLYTRMLLPLADDDRMPPEGKPSPKPEELALVQFWIERGASSTLRVRDALAPVLSRPLLERSLGGAAPTSVTPLAAPASNTSLPISDPAAGDSATPRSDGRAATAATAASAKSLEREREASSPPSARNRATSGPAFLATYCEKCHGGAKQKGKLRVDSLAALLRGGAGGPALVPGQPEQSSVVQRLRLPLADDEHMPPAKESQPSAVEVAALAAWIRSGAAGAVGSSAPSAAPTAVASNAAAPSAAAPPVTESAARVGPPAAAEPNPTQASFSAVQSLLREKCGKCHIREKPAGGFGVAQHAQLMEGGYSGAGIVPRDRRASVLMQRLLLPTSDEEHMPPTDEPALSAAEIELVGVWIDRGAPDNEGTKVAAPVAPPPPAASPPGKSGGCAACSVPGAQSSPWLALQAFVMLGAFGLTTWRRRGRAARVDPQPLGRRRLARQKLARPAPSPSIRSDLSAPPRSPPR